MADPTTTSALSVAMANLSIATMAVLGVNHLALLWAAVGAITVLLYSEPTHKGKAAMATLLSTLLGAAIGTAVADHLGGAPSVLLVASIVGASGPQPLISAALNSIVTQINRTAGKPSPNDVPPNQ